MARIRTSFEITQSLLDFFRIALPQLDTSVGQEARDLFVDGDAAELGKLYAELAQNSNKQSLKLAVGVDVDNWLLNFSEFRKKGSKAQVTAILTFSSLEVDLAINKGDLITSKTGLSFIIKSSLVLSPVNLTKYQAVAAKYKADFDFLGITDSYAVEILAEASVEGSQGNISKYSLIDTNISGISNVTNVIPASDGNDTESDSMVKSRFFSILFGTNSQSAPGYRNLVSTDSAIIDSVVIEAGDELMTRDGTQIFTAEDGTKTIISEGTGGKVDVIIFGSRLEETTDSFIYRDLSNTNDPTSSKNDFILGQILEDKNKIIFKKRIDELKTGILPSQPVNNIISVSGSLSGNNFQEKVVDNLGRISGNYELIKDSGDYAGSPWAFDKFHWISNKISNFSEDKSKSSFNGQDPLSFADVIGINKITQNISITNENSFVLSSDRTIIQLTHFPCTAVTRVFNLTTGERYLVTNQNLDGASSVNISGKIKISGKTLPSSSDILQVDYTWIFSYDPYTDFDNKIISNNPRIVDDSVDWGYSNAVKKEETILNSNAGVVIATVTHAINAVINVNKFLTFEGPVTLISGRIGIVLPVAIENVLSITKISDGSECFNTNLKNGTFSGFTLFLPTDAVINVGDIVLVKYNSVDLFSLSSANSFNGNQIIFSTSLSLSSGTIVECNYIADINIILPPTILANLPVIKNGNNFKSTFVSSLGNQPTSFQNIKILRNAPTNLSLNISGNILYGTILISGSSFIPLYDIVFTSSSNGLKQDLSLAIRNALNLSSKTQISSKYKIVRVAKFEKVITENSNSNEVISSIFTYDLKNYSLNDNQFDSDAIKNISIKNTEIILPATPNNELNSIKIGDKIRVTFYLVLSNFVESCFFSKPGTIYTQSKFIIIDSISVSSGFTDAGSKNAVLSVSNMNQPSSRSRYKVFYDYTAPKPNERITIDYNFDKLIGDTTLLVDKQRLINADVLIKAATPILVDVTMNIVVSDDFINNPSLVIENVNNTISSFLQLKRIPVDSSDLIQIAYTVSGVDRARILFFNKTGNNASVLSIIPQKNEYIFPNNININSETR